MTIFIGFGITFCGILVAGWSSGFVKAVGILMILGGLVASAVGVVRLVVRLVVRFWRWGTGRNQIEEEEAEEEEEDEPEAVLPESEPERIDLEEVARIAEIAVLRHMVNYLDLDRPSAPSVENVVIEAEDDEDAAEDDEDEEEEEEEDGMSDCLKEAIARAEEAEREAQEQEDIEYLEGYLSQLEKRLNVLLLRKDRLLALGTKESSRSWRGNEYDINYTKREIANSKNELRKIKVGF